MNDFEPRFNVWTWVRRLAIYPPLIAMLGSCVFLGTPIPSWHYEELKDPVDVVRVEADHLTLADGRQLRLPCIAELPIESPIFLAALGDGVEVAPNGQVVGLIEVTRTCGLDPCIWQRLRVNLSELAGTLHPDGIDRTIVPREEIEHLADYKITPYYPDRESLNQFERLSLKRYGELFDYALKQAGKKPPDVEATR